MIASLSIAVALGATGVAQAATDEAEVVVSGGAATMSEPDFANFPSVTLNGQQQSVTTSLDGNSSWRVNDARGTGAGWNVAVEASVPETAGNVVMTGAVISVASPVAAKVDGDNASAAPTTATGAITSGGVTAFTAASNQGLGRWDLDADLTLQVPAAAKAGTYSSTVTTTYTAANLT